MPCEFPSFQVSPKLHEEHLKSKICELQTQLMEFNRHISPAKEKQTATATQCEIKECSWQDCWFVFCILATFKTSITLIGGVVYIVWPLCFPAFVYMGEGFTYFFWQVVSVSTLVSVAMLMKMASDINQLRFKYTKKLSRKMKEVRNWLAESTSADELDIFTKKLLATALIVGLCLILLVLVYKNSIDIKYIIGAALLATGFCCGACMSYSKQRGRGYDGILPLINCDEAVSISPIRPCSASTPSSSWLHIWDLAREHGCTPLKYHPSPPPPPTYKEAVEDNISARKSPACRMALFQ